MLPWGDYFFDGIAGALDTSCVESSEDYKLQRENAMEKAVETLDQCGQLLKEEGDIIDLISPICLCTGVIGDQISFNR